MDPNYGLLILAAIYEPIREVSIHDEELATRRFSMMRIMARWMNAATRAALAGLDEGEFTEGYELDRKTEKQVPKAMVGRRLLQEEAKRLLAKFD